MPDDLVEGLWTLLGTARLRGRRWLTCLNYTSEGVPADAIRWAREHNWIVLWEPLVGEREYKLELPKNLTADTRWLGWQIEPTDAGGRIGARINHLTDILVLLGTPIRVGRLAGAATYNDITELEQAGLVTVHAADAEGAAGEPTELAKIRTRVDKARAWLRITPLGTQRLRASTV